MEEPEQQTPQEQANPSYWNSVFIAGVLFGLILFVISTIGGYATISSEPTGAIFSPTQLIGTVGCLFGAFGGMLATWHFAREYDTVIKLGRGALIGFLVGLVIVAVNILLVQIWSIIDPDMTQQMIDSAVANIEAMDVPDQQKQMTIDMTVDGLRSRENIGSQLLWGIPMYGILNLITGMIGAKLFGKEETEF